VVPDGVVVKLGAGFRAEASCSSVLGVRVLAIVHQDDADPGVFADAVRGYGVLDTWHLPSEREPPRQPCDYDALMTFGGAMHPDDELRHLWLAREKKLLAELLAHGPPLLGVCLGAELLVEAAGGRARRARDPEIGWFDVQLTDAGAADPLFAPLDSGFVALEWHSYECSLPADAVPLASSKRCLQAFRLGERAWGIQFHAEVTGADVESWIDDYRSDEDALRAGLDPDVLRERTRQEIDRWNQIGLGLCERFLDVATRT
jgi:GMP synthase-like glutamine amidotransferase